jgi:hypothetical protein
MGRKCFIDGCICKNPNLPVRVFLNGRRFRHKLLESPSFELPSRLPFTSVKTTWVNGRLEPYESSALKARRSLW